MSKQTMLFHIGINLNKKKRKYQLWTGIFDSKKDAANYHKDHVMIGWTRIQAYPFALANAFDFDGRKKRAL